MNDTSSKSFVWTLSALPSKTKDFASLSPEAMNRVTYLLEGCGSGSDELPGDRQVVQNHYTPHVFSVYKAKQVRHIPILHLDGFLLSDILGFWH